jgi:hypothetical protein
VSLQSTYAFISAVSRLYKVHEESGKPFELEMSWICEESGWKHARVRTLQLQCADVLCGACVHAVPSASCNKALQTLQIVVHASWCMRLLLARLLLERQSHRLL